MLQVLSQFSENSVTILQITHLCCTNHAPTHYATGAIPISLLYLCLSSSMLTRISSVTALGINGVRTFYGKTIPDHTLKWEYPILFSNRFVQVFHRHGDRTPLHNYLQGSPQEKDEVQMWKQLVRSLFASHS